MRAMHIHQFIEVFLDDFSCDVHIAAVLFALQLQQDAFTHVAGADAGRVQCLHHVDHLFDLRRVHIVAVVERHVVGNLGGAAAQVSRILQVAHDGLGNHLLRLVEFKFSQLVEQCFLHRLLAHRRGTVVFVIEAAVVGKVAVPRHRVIVAAVGTDGLVIALAFRMLLLFLAIILVVVLVLVRLLLESLDFVHFIIDEFGHLGIAFFQHLAQQALLFQRLPLLQRLFLH